MNQIGKKALHKIFNSKKEALASLTQKWSSKGIQSLATLMKKLNKKKRTISIMRILMQITREELMSGTIVKEAILDLIHKSADSILTIIRYKPEAILQWIGNRPNNNRICLLLFRKCLFLKMPIKQQQNSLKKLVEVEADLNSFKMSLRISQNRTSLPFYNRLIHSSQ